MDDEGRRRHSVGAEQSPPLTGTKLLDALLERPPRLPAAPQDPQDFLQYVFQLVALNTAISPDAPARSVFLQALEAAGKIHPEILRSAASPILELVTASSALQREENTSYNPDRPEEQSPAWDKYVATMFQELRHNADADSGLPDDAVVELVKRAAYVVGPDDVARWLNTRVPSLHGRTPLSLMGTEEGRKQIETVLGRIEHGIF